MPSFDPRVDQYISKSAGFAQTILLHLRELVHRTCPEVTENIKWGMPMFEYNKSILCNMAAFKQHCAFGFWLGKFMDDPQNILGERENAMGQLGRITRLEDLPKDSILENYIREAMRLTDAGVKQKSSSKSDAPKVLTVPDYLLEALKTSKAAQEQFEKFSYSHKKEYVEWVTEAKTEPTRNKRIAQMLEMLAEGKSRHWKYER